MIKNNHIHQGPRSSRTPSVMGSLYVNSPIVLKDIYSSKINSSRAVPGTWHQPRKLLSPLPSQPLHLCRLILGIFQGKGRSPGLLVASLFQISPVLPYLRPAPQAARYCLPHKRGPSYVWAAPWWPSSGSKELCSQHTRPVFPI